MIRISYLLVGLVFFFLSTNVYCQKKILVGNSNDKIYFQKNDTLEEVDFNGKLIFKKKLNADIKLFSSHKLLNINSQLYFIHISGGAVYGLVENEFKRIDNSFNHKMTNYSDSFIYNDTIFKFGGYGYWSSRNFLTYYSFTSNEWEYYKTNGEIIPTETSMFNSALVDNKYYVFNGKQVDYNSGANEKRVSDLFVFDFQSRSWENLGNITFMNYTIGNLSEKGIEYIIDNNSSENFGYSINYDKNLITKYKIDKNSIGLGKNSFILNDTIYLIKEGRVHKHILQDFFSSPIKSSKFYANNPLVFWKLCVAILSVLAIICSIYFYWKKKSKISIRGNYLFFNGNKIIFDDKEILILKKIKSKNYVLSQEIYDLIENKELSFPQNNKVKNDYIIQINKKILSQFGIQNFISSNKLTKDKRITTYYTKYRSRIILK